MKFETVREAAQNWVREFNAFPRSMVEKLMSINIDDWHDITIPSECERVYHFDSSECGEIEKVKTNEDGERIYVINLDNDKTVECSADDFERDGQFELPMWGTMWQFDDSCDDYWIEEMGGLAMMSDCGFRIFQSEEYGYFFGIDGAGYDFYEAHWIPLYNARGLHWHKEETEDTKD